MNQPMRLPLLAVSIVLPALLVFCTLAQKTFSQQDPSAASRMAEPVTLPVAAVTRPATQALDPHHYLGREIRSPEYGLVFSVPADCKAAQGSMPDVVGEYVNDKQWAIRIDRVILRQSTPLTVHSDETGHAAPGVLEGVQNQYIKLPSFDLARKEVVKVNGLDMGVLFIRYQTANDAHWTIQKAVVQAPFAYMDQKVYYFLEFTAPDQDEETLAGVFDALIHSVQVLDTKDIAKDQIARLNNTQLLFLNWNGAANEARIRKVLVDEQWLRIIHDGKDAGYTCVLQQCPANPKTNKPGDLINILIGTRMIPKPGQMMSAVSSMTCTVDRKHEGWRTLFTSQDEKQKVDQYTELGMSDEVDKSVVLPPAADPTDIRNVGIQGNIKLFTNRTLTVNATRNHANLDKFEQMTPAWYCPQAISYLLPRLLPVSPPRKYLVAVYDNGTGSDGVGRIVARYLEVLLMAKVKFNGQEVMATTIEDRVTLQGPVTRHYFAADGTYLGSQTTTKDDDGAEHVSMVVPSTEQELRRAWPQFNVDKPAESELPERH